MCVWFNISLVCLHVCAYAFKSKVHCGSALGPGCFGLFYYCTLLVCVPAVSGGLVVWRHNNKKKSQERKNYNTKPKTINLIIATAVSVWITSLVHVTHFQSSIKSSISRSEEPPWFCYIVRSTSSLPH